MTTVDVRVAEIAARAEAVERVEAYLAEVSRINAAQAGRSWAFGDVVHGLNEFELRRSDIAALLSEVRRLRSVVEDAERVIAEAPHGTGCRWNVPIVPGFFEGCTCWKSRLGADQ